VWARTPTDDDSSGYSVLKYVNNHYSSSVDVFYLILKLKKDFLGAFIIEEISTELI
jgi:hypothetical protein